VGGEFKHPVAEIHEKVSRNGGGTVS